MRRTLPNSIALFFFFFSPRRGGARRFVVAKPVKCDAHVTQAARDGRCSHVTHVAPMQSRRRKRVEKGAARRRHFKVCQRRAAKLRLNEPGADSRRVTGRALTYIRLLAYTPSGVLLLPGRAIVRRLCANECGQVSSETSRSECDTCAPGRLCFEPKRPAPASMGPDSRGPRVAAR